MKFFDCFLKFIQAIFKFVVTVVAIPFTVIIIPLAVIGGVVACVYFFFNFLTSVFSLFQRKGKMVVVKENEDSGLLGFPKGTSGKLIKLLMNSK